MLLLDYFPYLSCKEHKEECQIRERVLRFPCVCVPKCPGQRLVVDQSLQHHHEAARPLAQCAVGILLQVGEEFGPNLGQH